MNEYPRWRDAIREHRIWYTGHSSKTIPADEKRYCNRSLFCKPLLFPSCCQSLTMKQHFRLKNKDGIYLFEARSPSRIVRGLPTAKTTLKGAGKRIFFSSPKGKTKFWLIGCHSTRGSSGIVIGSKKELFLLKLHFSKTHL